MKLLADYPPTLLSELFSSKHSSFLVLKLWLCGDATLNQKLRHCISRMHLKDGRTSTRSSFPKLLSQLSGLRHLTILREDMRLAPSAALLLADLKTLPTLELETLKLHCHEAKYVFRENNDAQDFDNDSDSELNWGFAPASQLLDLNELFPKLKTLGLSSMRYLRTSSMQSDDAIQTLFESDLIRLPHSLTKLITPRFWACGDTGAVFSKLPRTLVEWKTSITMDDYRWRKDSSHRDYLVSEAGRTIDTPILLKRLWNDAPPSLTSVHRYYHLFSQGFTSFDYLPRTLENMVMEVDELVWTTEHFTSLPRGLKNLWIEFQGPNIDDDYYFMNKLQIDAQAEQKSKEKVKEIHWITYAPPNLEQIVIINHYAHTFVLDSRFLTLLPNTLTCLEISTQEQSIHSSYAELEEVIVKRQAERPWLPNLRTWEITGPALPGQFIGLLPRSLTKINFTLQVDGVFPSELLPPNLRSLILRPEGASLLTLNPGLPKSLTLFHMYSRGECQLDPQSRPLLLSSVDVELF